MSSSLEWEKPGKIYVVLQRFKSERKQIGRGAACAVCRKLKRRCDGQRPCKSCISSKCEEKCLSSDESLAAVPKKVERPLPFEGKLKFRDNECLQSERARSLKFSFLKGFWDMGFREDALNDMFRFLPPRLQTVYKALSHVFESAISQAAKQPAVEDAQDRADPGRWADSTYCGWLNIAFDGVGKRKGVSMNGMMQHMWGAHLEELMARTGNQDLPLPSTEFRTLCAILDEFSTFEQESKIRHLVLFPGMLTNGPVKPQLFRQTWHKIVRDGIPRRTTTTYVPVSADQWDRALQQHPEARNKFLDEALGRAGRELDGNKGLWEEERIEVMVQTEEGRRKLDAVADLAFRVFHLPDTPAGSDTLSPAASDSGGSSCSLPSPQAQDGSAAQASSSIQLERTVPPESVAGASACSSSRAGQTELPPVMWGGDVSLGAGGRDRTAAFRTEEVDVLRGGLEGGKRPARNAGR